MLTYDDLAVLGKHVLSILHHYSITIFLPHKPKPSRVQIKIINPRIILNLNLNLYFKNKWIDQSIEIKVYHLWSRTSRPALWFINRIHVEGHKGGVGYWTRITSTSKMAYPLMSYMLVMDLQCYNEQYY